jgi:hypothetical protein
MMSAAWRAQLRSILRIFTRVTGRSRVRFPATPEGLGVKSAQLITAQAALFAIWHVLCSIFFMELVMSCPRSRPMVPKLWVDTVIANEKSCRDKQERR